MPSHWYTRQGGAVVRYKQITKAGTESKRINRGKALADGAVPSVTTLLDFLGEAGGLIHWATGKGIEAGLDVGMSAAISHEPRSVLVGLAREQAKESMERAATQGTAIHDAVERHLMDPAQLDPDPILRTAQESVAAWLRARGEVGPFRCEHALMFKGEIDGVKVAYGGTTDLVLDNLICDWKTVEDKGRGFRGPKFSEAAQLAAYRLAAHDMGLCDDVADCVNLYIDRRTGRIVDAIGWREAALRHGLSLLALAVDALAKVDKIEAVIKRQKGA